MDVVCGPVMKTLDTGQMAYGFKPMFRQKTSAPQSQYFSFHQSDGP